MRSIIRYLIPFGILVIWRKVYREIIRLISNYILVYRLNKYSKLNEILKLQLGCGKGLFDDWFNTDRTSKNNVSFLDVTLPFPIKDNYFDYIYSEHLIEHLEYHGDIIGDKHNELQTFVIEAIKPIDISNKDLFD